MLTEVIAIIGALTGLGSLWFTEKQWRKVNKKIAMLTDEAAASEILPTWYTRRMMTDYWSFGLQTSDGNVIAIRRICGVSDDGKWLDVELLTEDEVPGFIREQAVFAVADDRREASVQIEKIIAAYELVTS